jgi:hypothetical protein
MLSKDTEEMDFIFNKTHKFFETQSTLSGWQMLPFHTARK